MSGKRRKIVCYLPYTAVGGSHHSLLGFIEGLGPGWEAVAAYGESNPEFLQLYTSRGVRCEPLLVREYTQIRGFSHPLTLLRSLIQSVFKLRRLLRREHPDLLYSETIKGRLAASLAAWGLPPKVLGYVRDWRSIRLSDKLAFQLADAFVVISQAVLDRCFPQGRRHPEKTHLIYNGVDTERFKPQEPSPELLEKLGLDGCRVIMYCGRIVPWKRPDLVIRAAAELHHRGLDDVRLLLLGSLQEDIHPGSSAEFERVVEESGIGSRLIRPGFALDVRPYISLADVVAVPSEFEPFGRTVIEALAMERAVVGTTAGGIPEIIDHGVNGLLVPPGDHLALADALQELLEDPKRARRLARRGRETILRRFSLKMNQRRLNALVQELIGESVDE